MNSVTEPDSADRWHIGITLCHAVLPLGRTTQCINHTGEFDQQAIAGRFDDAAPVFGELRRGSTLAG
jgi:hypothetical protein